jgi:hypothetical protein
MEGEVTPFSVLQKLAVGKIRTGLLVSPMEEVTRSSVPRKLAESLGVDPGPVKIPSVFETELQAAAV